ncbi:tol protein [Apiospora arundinis]
MAIKQTTQDDWSHWLKHGCLPLFDIDRPVEYRYWKSDDCSFQLRCIGGPGSGKTTLSHIIVKDLENSFQGAGTAIISISIQPLSAHSEQGGGSYPISTQLLLEIQRQLRTYTAPSSGEKKIEGHDEVDTSQDKPSHEDGVMYEWIQNRMKPLDRAFLVIDDLDQAFCDIAQYQDIESHISRLQSLGFKILVTSRVPYQTGEISACDVETHTGPSKLLLWWECETCGPEVYDMCYECKDAGALCNQADHAECLLVQAPKKLTTPANKAARTAEDLVSKTVDRAGGNVTVARLRLDHIGKATTLKEARAVGDRLPRELVQVFDAAIYDMEKNSFGIQRFLGLHSIRLVAKHGGEKPFVELVEELCQAWKEDGQELYEVLDAEDAVEQILFAARGFLTSRRLMGGVMLACFQVDFRNYVAEDYSEVLSLL